MAAQKALSAIWRTGMRFGVGHLTDVLVGKATDKVRSWNHDALPTFGVGADLDEADWRGVFRQLAAAGLVQVALAEHGALKLTEDARPVLKGERRVELRRVVTGRAKGRRGRAAAVADLAPADAGLFERLRAWRTDTARRQGVPAYVILHDRTLRELAARCPTTAEELLDVPGIGDAKAERYGAAVLALLTSIN